MAGDPEAHAKSLTELTKSIPWRKDVLVRVVRVKFRRPPPRPPCHRASLSQVDPESVSRARASDAFREGGEDFGSRSLAERPLLEEATGRDPRE